VKKLNVLLTIILVVSLPVVTLAGCQEQTAQSPPNGEGEYVPNQIIVKFKPGTSSEAEEQLNQSLGTKVIHTSPSAGFKVLEIPEDKTVTEMVAIYSEQSIVEYAEPNYIERVQPEAK